MFLKRGQVQDQRDLFAPPGWQHLSQELLPDWLDLNALIAQKTLQPPFNTGHFGLGFCEQFLGHPGHHDAFGFDGSQHKECQHLFLMPMQQGKQVFDLSVPLTT